MVKLSKEKVVIIKQLLRKGEFTHQQLASQFSVSRQTITKINKSLRDPYHKNSRWGYIDELDPCIISETYISLELRDLFRSLNNEQAGRLIKSICKQIEG